MYLSTLTKFSTNSSLSQIIQLLKVMAKIKKIHVSTGVYILDIPEANLNILCGCPPDCIKHLLKRGLIVTTETNQISHETGPNVILLSDLAIQGEGFANMAEFPVLQMLYRQGMLIPGHPNNTGVKPLIMGCPTQIKAQTDYIYRGNYGLISEAELMAAGFSANEAKELMQIKLKFAFGRIKETTDFIDTLPIHSERIEIRNGAFIKRISSNVFEVDFNGETVIVDLNLQPFQHYDSPLNLGSHYISREYFAVVHSGEGDGWDTERPSMASIVMFQGKIYIIDAGPAILQTLKALGIGLNEIDGLFHTHAHDDHFAGLPDLLRTDKKIKYFATPDVRASMTKKLAALISTKESDIAHFLEFHDLKLGEWNYINALEVRPIASPHPVETTVLQFRALGNEGYKIYSHLADIASFKLIDDCIQMATLDPSNTANFAQKAKEIYQEPVTLKKIDISGGMIHGLASDFKHDQSEKIVLAHTALKLSNEQKEIGSEASFGNVDILIQNSQSFEMRSAFHYFHEDFPDLSPDEIRALINNPVVLLNPGEIFVKEGEKNNAIYLILSGYVEKVKTSSDIHSTHYAGTMVGEMSGLLDIPARHTYRTASYVKALRIPSQYYREFIEINHLHHEIERGQDSWIFLSETWLFGEGISYPTLNALTKQLTHRHLSKGEAMDLEQSNQLHLIKHGKVQLFKNKKNITSIGVGGIFGEGAALGKRNEGLHIIVTEDTEVYSLDAENLQEIPICRWKIKEVYDTRENSVN